MKCKWFNKAGQQISKFIAKIPKSILILVVLAAIFIFIPRLIARMVFSWSIPFLNDAPGGDEWFGFWASYLGVAATVIVSYFTYKNSKSIGEQEERYLDLVSGSNLRAEKVMIAQYKPNKGDTVSQYRFCIEFINASFSMITNLSVAAFKIKNDDKNNPITVKLESQEYLVQGDRPRITFDIVFEKGSEAEKIFTDFYYYDYVMNSDLLSIVLDIEPKLYGYKSDDNDDNNGSNSNSVQMTLCLKMTMNIETEYTDILYTTNKDIFLPMPKIIIYRYRACKEQEKNNLS